ncbi:hypothetical protein QO179_25180 [Bacillus stercoris]|nr:hypothetical protein [Bacillus stercoris]
MKEITIWTLVTETSEKHNHIENGWAEGEYPTPTKSEYKNQEAWNKLDWKKEFGYLDDQNKVCRRS